jgi:serine/threonine protein kinase
MQRQSVPTQIHDIQLRELVGQGAMGQVYLAERQGQQVAVKVVNPGLLRVPSVVARFRAEARVLTRIAHPNVVQVLDFGDLPDGTLYLVLEWLDGVGLDVLLQRRGRFSLLEALPYARQICAALEAAHDLGVVHRDLKPENVMVLHDAPLTLKVLDFGVAKQINPGAANTELTTVGELVGTPLYMAPEQIDHRLGYSVGPWTDVYALGLLLYTMLGGEHPFEAESLSGVLIQNLHRDPEPLLELAPDLPEPVAAVVHRCLEKAPQRRFSGARELIVALQDAVESACPLHLGELTGERQLPEAQPAPAPAHPRSVESELDEDPTCFYSAQVVVDDDEQTAVNFDVPGPVPGSSGDLPPGEPPVQATLLTQLPPVTVLPRQKRRRRHAWIAWLALTLCALGFEVAVALALVLA